MASVKFPVPEAIKMLDFDKRKTPDNKATECTCSLRKLAVLYSRDGRAAVGTDSTYDTHYSKIRSP